MTWLAFLISIAYVPGWTGISIPTGWAAMSLTLPWVVWKPTRLNPLHWLGAAFILYAFVSLRWAPRSDDAVNELWHLSVIAFAFVLGSKVDLTPLWRGLAWGCAVSSALAVVQWWGGHDWQPIPTADWGKPPGLFFNNAVAGAVAVVVMVANRKSLWAWAPFPLFVLSQSRGAWAALLVTIFINVDRCGKVLIGTASILVTLFAWPHFHSASDSIRIDLWSAVLHHLSWFGNGAGSLMSIYMLSNGQVFHVEHAHNDFLSLVYTYGLGVAPLAAMVAVLLCQWRHAEWPTLICCLALSTVFWTMETPVTAFALALLAGRMCSDSGLVWADLHYRRLGFVHRAENPPTLASRAGRRAIPV